MIEGQLIQVLGWPQLQGGDDQKFLGDVSLIPHDKVVGDTQSKGGLRRPDPRYPKARYQPLRLP